MEHQCCAMRYENFSEYQCSRKGKIERDGKWYCKQHDPVEVERRRKESDERYQREAKERNEAWKRQCYALAAVEGISTQALKEGIIKSMLYCLTQIIQDLPERRDWLDPDIERMARELLAELEAK